jgi:hypothetical protein
MSTPKNKIEDMMERMDAGLPGAKPREQGPIGDAVEVLISVIRDTKRAGVFDTSATLKAADVLVDFVHVQRKTIQSAVDFVNAFEECLGKEWTPQRVQALTLYLERFKLEAVKARMHQFVPSPKDPEGPKVSQ